MSSAHVAVSESSDSSIWMEHQIEKAALIRKSFHCPKWWVLVFGWCLAFCAGAANVIAFKSWNLYASHVTGSTSAMAFKMERRHITGASESLTEPFCMVFSFLLGAYACGLLIDTNYIRLGKAFYGFALVLTSALLTFSSFLPGRLLPACLVAAACGLQNAMCTSHFGAIVRTSHVTGTVTDLGSILGRISMVYLRRSYRRSALNVIECAELNVDRRKFFVLFGLWSSYFLGGLAGVYLENFMLGPPQRVLLMPAICTGAMGICYMAFRRMLKDYMKKLAQERSEMMLRHIKRSLSNLSGRLHRLQPPCGGLTSLDLEVGTTRPL